MNAQPQLQARAVTSGCVDWIRTGAEQAKAAHMFQPTKRTWCVAAAVLVVATGCGNSDATTPAASTSTAATPTTPAGANPSSTQLPTSPATPSPSRTAPSPSPRSHTVKELKAARLSLKDIPAGFEVDKAAGDDGARLSSTKAACAPLVRIMNAAKLPGSKAQAEISFSGGQDGPFIDENLDAMGTKRAAGIVIDSYRKAVKACRSVTVRVSGAGASKVEVREISFGNIGDDTFSARFRATEGDLAGLEIIQVGVQSGDVVVGMSFVGLEGPDAETATDDAVKKVEQKLATSGSI